MYFKATIDIICINPFVFVPENILQEIFKKAGRSKGPIPVRGKINNKAYKQTLVKYSGAWRFYINTMMLENSPKRIGEEVEITIDFDPVSRAIEPPSNFVKALSGNPEAKAVFESLPASRQHEIVRYIVNLKSEAAKEKNIKRAISFLLGKESFVGRDKP